MLTDYLVIQRAGPSSYPLLEWDQSASAFRKGKPVTVTEPIRLRLGAPVPPKPVMVDHHSLPHPVFSTRVKDALEPLSLHRVQLIPADVRMPSSETLRYWLLHVYNELACLDRRKSKCSVDLDDGGVLGIDKLVLDEEVLKDIPLHERLVFRLAESTSVYLFHSSVMRAVMALQPRPEGMRFLQVDAWNDSAAFKP